MKDYLIDLFFENIGKILIFALSVLLLLSFRSCYKSNEKRKLLPPVKHQIYTHNGISSETYNITSEISMRDGCATFTYISNWNGEFLESKTLCGSFEINY